MANARRVRSHVHETKALNYGHLGTASYDGRDHEWRFLRQRNSGIIHDDSELDDLDLGAFELANEEVLYNSASPARDLGKIQASAKIGSLQNQLLINTPEAACLATGISALAYGTDHLHEAPSTAGSIADVLAIGYARPPLEPNKVIDTPGMPILAFRSGACKEVLQLLGLETRRSLVLSGYGLPERCSLPYVADQAAGSWSDSTDEILHVDTVVEQLSTRFLVVKASGTTILHPALSREILLPATSDSNPSGPVVIVDPVPLVTIPSSRTGEQPQVHACFNPINCNLIAIVDAFGQWSTWKLKERTLRTPRVLNRAHLQASNNLVHALRSRLTSSTVPAVSDTWHRICWFKATEGDVYNLLVCNRRFAAVFDQAGGFCGQIDLRLGALSSRHVVLDVRASAYQPSLLFVLTTSQLLIFTSGPFSDGPRAPKQPLELLCSWKHFRDKADMQLRTTVLEDPQGLHILLYSCTSTFVVLYRFDFDTTPGTALWPRDPVQVDLPPQLQERFHDVQALTFCPISLSADDRLSVDIQRGFVKLVASTSSGYIIDAVCRYGMLHITLPSECLPKFPVLMTSETLTSRKRSATYIEEDELDEFVVSTTSIPTISNRSQQYHPGASRTVLSRMRAWQSVWPNINAEDNAGTGLSIQAFLWRTTTRIEEAWNTQDPARLSLLCDSSQGCSFTALEEDLQVLARWLERMHLRDDVNVEAIVSRTQYSTQQLPQQLQATYHDFVAAHVSPLPVGITDRQRINRERSVRHILGSLFSSQLLLRSTSEAIYSPNTPEAPYPTPGPDSDDGSDRKNSFEISRSTTEEPSVARLRRYVHFRYQVPPLLHTQTPMISSILTHMPKSMDEDPKDYSYQETNHRFQLAQEELAAESLDPKERERARRSAARLQRKLERNQELSQNLMSQRNALPSIGPAVKSSTLPGRDIQSSQAGAVPASSQAGGQHLDHMPGVSMTQPERGAFGGRQAAKKPKKRRAGF